MKRSVFLVVILVCLKLKTINVAYLFNLVFFIPGDNVPNFLVHKLIFT